MFVMDSFALPVEGTETRVNAQSAAYEYMTAYIESAKKVNRLCVQNTNYLKKLYFIPYWKHWSVLFQSFLTMSKL